MKTNTVSNPATDIGENASWLPMVVIAMGQMLMSFNVAALPVSMTGFFVLACMALFAMVPCGWLPDYRPGELPSDKPART